MKEQRECLRARSSNSWAVRQPLGRPAAGMPGAPSWGWHALCRPRLTDMVHTSWSHGLAGWQHSTFCHLLTRLPT
jgi:hypothetical protein